MQWFRRSFLAGFFITVPLVISVAAFVWIFQVVDGLMGPIFARWLGVEVPGLGIITTALGVFLVGALATNVLGKRLLQQAERFLLMVPVFKTIYSPVKQLIAAFAPDNEAGFKRVALVELPHRGFVLGFITREFVVDRGAGPEPMAAVYVPTNHLYLGDVLVFPRSAVSYPDLSVEEGVRVFLTGGVALASRVTARQVPAESSLDSVSRA